MGESGENLDMPLPPLGKTAVESGFLTREQLGIALKKYHGPTEGNDGSRALAEYLVEWGFLTSNQAEDLLGEPEKRVFTCPGCGSSIPILGEGASEGTRIECPDCAWQLEKPEGLEEFAEVVDPEGVTAPPPGRELPADGSGARVVPCPACGKNIPILEASNEGGTQIQCPTCGWSLERPEGLEDFAESVGAEDMTAAPPGTIAPEDQDKSGDVDESSASLSLIGDIVGNCRVVDHIGEGGMGVVYRAHHILLNREVALKILPRSLDLSVTKVQRFMQEAGSLGALTSPNIVQVFNVGEERGNYFIEMEFVDGGTLEEQLSEKGRLNLEEALPIMKAVLHGLVAAHDKEIIHRDLKPGNILISKAGEYKIADFGLAKSLQERSYHTRDGSMMGTPQYMSPEQCRGKEVDRRSDVYSLGAVFYQMLTGVLPFDSEDPLVVVLKQMNEEVQSPRKHAPDLPLSYSNLVDRMMAKDPEERFQDAEDVRTAIEDIEQGIELVYTAKRVRRRRVRAILATVLILTLCVVAAVGARAYLQLQEQREEIKSKTPQRRAEKLMNEGKALFDAGDFGVAALKFREAMETWDGLVGADKLVARVEFLHGISLALNEGDAGKALTLLDGYVEAQGEDEFSSGFRKKAELLREARAAMDSERWSEGIESIDGFLAQMPSNDSAHRLKSALTGLSKSRSLSENDDRITALTVLLALKHLEGEFPKLPEAHEAVLDELDRKVATLLWEKRLNKGRELALEVLSVEVHPPILRKKGQIEELLAEFKRLKEEGEAKFNKGDFTGAQADFRKANKITSSKELDDWLTDTAFNLVLERARLAREAKRFDEAYEAYERAKSLQRKPGQVAPLVQECRREDGMHRFNKAKVACSTGDLAAATHSLKLGLDAWPDEELPGIVEELETEIRNWEETPPGTRYIPGGRYPVGPGESIVDVGPLYLDVLEVTNEQYMEFVKAGGYEKEDLWNTEGWKLRSSFTERSGKHPGPAHWVNGDHPNGEGELPVTFISWYEADAYARWRGGRLPSRDEWMVAASWSPLDRKQLIYPWGEVWKAEAANVGTPEEEWPLAKPGSFPEDESPLGFFDVAGNVSEWTSTRASRKEGCYLVKGGSTYHATAKRVELANDRLTAPPHRRLAIIGLRPAYALGKDGNGKEKGK